MGLGELKPRPNREEREGGHSFLTSTTERKREKGISVEKSKRASLGMNEGSRSTLFGETREVVTSSKKTSGKGAMAAGLDLGRGPCSLGIRGRENEAERTVIMGGGNRNKPRELFYRTPYEDLLFSPPNRQEALHL